MEQILFLCFLLVQQPVWAQNDIVQPATYPKIPSDTDDVFMPVGSTTRNDVEKDLQCIQTKSNHTENAINNPKTTKMFRLLAVPLQDGFKRFQFSPFEKAMFYSQVLDETAAFTLLPEAPVKAQSGLGTLGLVPFSGCGNFISVVHYLNLMNANKTPEWKQDWTYKDATGASRRITDQCSKEQLKAFASEYRRIYGKDVNLYGAIDNPARFAVVGESLKDPISGKTIASEQFMTDASLAQWRGKCGKVVYGASDINGLGAGGPCAEFTKGDNADLLVAAVKCVTQCVHGSIKGWQKRLEYMKAALSCAH